jgi:hypothetical protein
MKRFLEVFKYKLKIDDITSNLITSNIKPIKFGKSTIYPVYDVNDINMATLETCNNHNYIYTDNENIEEVKNKLQDMF